LITFRRLGKRIKTVLLNAYHSGTPLVSSKSTASNSAIGCQIKRRSRLKKGVLFGPVKSVLLSRNLSLSIFLMLALRRPGSKDERSHING
jgi:hypothetical protein